jgi:HK97 family phage major capsid protein
MAATLTGDFSGFLSPAQAAPYFDQARRQSVLMGLGREVPLGPNGVETPVVTSKAQAAWVAEGGQKQVSKGSVGLKSMAPKKIAAIAVVSAEVVRANPANYIQLFKDDVAESMALAFDSAGFHGTSSPFAANIDGAAVGAIELTSNSATHTVYDDLVAALDLIKAQNDDAGRRYRVRNFAFDDLEESRFLGAKDGNGLPLWVDAPFEGTVLQSGRLLGRQSIMTEGIATADGTSVVGYAGDFSQVVWGRVGGITYDVSTEATVTIDGTLTSLWEHNLVAIRAEAEFGLLINTRTSDSKAPFVKFTNATADV